MKLLSALGENKEYYKRLVAEAITEIKAVLCADATDVQPAGAQAGDHELAE